jgi:hypothetical protein
LSCSEYSCHLPGRRALFSSSRQPASHSCPCVRSARLLRTPTSASLSSLVVFRMLIPSLWALRPVHQTEQLLKLRSPYRHTVEHRSTWAELRPMSFCKACFHIFGLAALVNDARHA